MQKETKRRCTIVSLLRELTHYKKGLILGNIISVLSTLLTVATPLLIPILVDELLLHKGDRFIKTLASIFGEMSTSSYVWTILGLILTMRTASTLLAIGQSKIFTTIAKEITYALRVRMLEHLAGVSLKAYESMKVGAVTSKLVTDVETIDGFIGTTISKLIVSALILIFSAIVLLWIDWKLALFILFSNPIVVLFTVKLSRKIGRYKKEENHAIESFQSALSETLELFHQIKAANKERYFFDRNTRKAATLKQRSVSYAYKSDAAMKLSYLVFLSGYELFRAVSILAVAYGDLSIGLMLAIFSYLWVMVSPTQDLINFQYTLATARAACKRIDAIFAMPKEPAPVDSIDPFDKREEVEIETEKLSFAYREGNDILKNITLSIPPKRRVAIVGASGSGKTTLAQILVGFYPVERGKVYYNGIVHTRVSLEKIRDRLYLILQNPKLFNDTMRFNLTLGEAYDETRLWEALRMAQLDEVVRTMEKGLDTQVGRDGIKLSGGQRQRVAIARMILADPAVVIFDESTSALDVHTEAKLFEALESFLAKRTVITIAHRLSTIKSADYVYVLEEGELVDEGTPQALLAKDESYFSKML